MKKFFFGRKSSPLISKKYQPKRKEKKMQEKNKDDFIHKKYLNDHNYRRQRTKF